MSLFPLLLDASFSLVSFISGMALGMALGLAGGVNAVAFGVSFVKLASSLLTPLCALSLSTADFETHSESGVSFAFSVAVSVLVEGAVIEPVLLRSPFVSSLESEEPFIELPSTRRSSAPAEGGFRVTGGLTLEAEPSDSSVFKGVRSEAAVCLDPESRDLIGDRGPFVRARGKTWHLDGELGQLFTPSSKPAFSVSRFSSSGMSSSGGIWPPRCRRMWC